MPSATTALDLIAFCPGLRRLPLRPPERAKSPGLWLRLRAAGLGLFTVLALAAAPAQAQQMVSVSKQAYLRDGAGTQHEARWLLDPGYPLVVLGRQGNWLQVRDFEDDTGWIYRPLTSAVRHHVVTSATANIRRGPGTNTRVVGRAKYGEVLRTLDKREHWVKVKKPGGPTGWVARRLLWGW